MAKHALSYMELHNPFFMQGTNMKTKIDSAKKGAKLLLDDERSGVWIYYKGKVSFIPIGSIVSIDLIDLPEDVRSAIGATKEAVMAETPIAKRGRPAKAAATPLEIPMAMAYAPAVPVPTFDPTDAEAAARHRALVRAASANSNRAQPIQAQNDHLIQEARNAAMGAKGHRTAQVSSAQQVGEVASLKGKPKAISHAELKAQTKE